MAINKNHEFEELDGVKCGIVEKNVTAKRAAFLRELLETNGYEVRMVPSTPPKAPPVVNSGAPEAAVENAVPMPSTFTIGVTDYTFNPINAIFGRLLKTANGKVVTLDYWQQKDDESHEEIPYFGTGAG